MNIDADKFIAELEKQHERYNRNASYDDDEFNRDLAIVYALEAVIDAVKAAK